MIADRHDRRAIETLKDIGGDRPVGSSLGFWQYREAAQVSSRPSPEGGESPEVSGLSAGPESGLSGRGVQGVGARPRRTPGNRMDLRRM